MKKKLPIGIQTFKDIRGENYCYIDKSEHAYNLIEGGRYYFLSRPRRFGKSLFLDTLSEIFKGSRELFEGLYIYEKWDWGTTYPVIKINFNTGNFSTKENILKSVVFQLTSNMKTQGVECDNNGEDYFIGFRELIEKVYEKYNRKVVVLVDEYDKPILDNVADKEMAISARKILRSFYSAIKASDEFLKFVFVTGVSKFSKMNLFSELNNLEDITIDSNYATITGYTHNDLQKTFSEYLEGVDLEKVKKWYNGYNYFGESIYNPFDILLFISKGCEFKNYWWETGNPNFLIEKLKEQNYYIPDLENIIVGEETLNTFDVEKIDAAALLWQTGYLTFDKKIVDDITSGITYKMKIPNLEIQLSLNTLFMDYLTNLGHEKIRIQTNLKTAFVNKDFETFKKSLTTLFASIPYTNYVNNTISNFEGYYSSVVFTCLASLGFDIITEDATNRDRIDMTLKIPDAFVIMEFKVDKKEAALSQIHLKKYYEKYLSAGRDIFLVGISFDSKKKNVAAFEWEKVIPVDNV